MLTVLSDKTHPVPFLFPKFSIEQDSHMCTLDEHTSCIWHLKSFKLRAMLKRGAAMYAPPG